MSGAKAATVGTMWCDICHRSVDAGEFDAVPACPTCGEPLAERRQTPWHFKLMAVATVVYLGWRAYQGVGWLIHHV